MTNSHEPLKTFRVRVGHWEVTLKANTADEAIQEAKKMMVRELPRLYDVIRTLTANRFQVEAAA